MSSSPILSISSSSSNTHISSPASPLPFLPSLLLPGHTGTATGADWLNALRDGGEGLAIGTATGGVTGDDCRRTGPGPGPGEVDSKRAERPKAPGAKARDVRRKDGRDVVTGEETEEGEEWSEEDQTTSDSSSSRAELRVGFGSKSESSGCFKRPRKRSDREELAEERGIVSAMLDSSPIFSPLCYLVVPSLVL